MLYKPKGISLHIGLNTVNPTHYAGWDGQLYACEADAEDMESLAKSQSYSTSTLLTARATRAAVTASIRDAAGVLKAGDIFFLTYSGHGGQLPDRNDDEDDSLDETWCLYDSELIDDQLYELFTRFQPGVRIFMLSDSCHSGSVSKDQYELLQKSYGDLRRIDPHTGRPVTTFRGMPIDIARKTYFQNRSEYDAQLAAADPNAKSKVSATVRLISGCQDDQLSSDGTFNGLFTACLKRVWKSGKFDGTYAAFHKAIHGKMPAVQKPVHSVYGGKNEEFEAQRPFAI